ncbi:unnamed protein product [Fraxinus pennsylvanica]|uniref:Uncharacterized protein n=1 Tax=Fraxinus pennsylvanica TaxID=56036 RepID=A0AAD1YLN7_9LAMI|nr:unnamed protein product [Fraxinus pennsylvanica]
MDHDRVGIKRCYGAKGFRMNSRRFSVGRIRRKFLYLFRLLGRWKCSYSNALRSLKRNIITRRRGRGRGRNGKDSIHMELPYSYGYSSDHHQYRVLLCLSAAASSRLKMATVCWDHLWCLQVANEKSST